MKITVSQAATDAVNSGELIESETVKEIMGAVAGALREVGLQLPERASDFLINGTILLHPADPTTPTLRDDLRALIPALGLKGDDVVLINALIRYVEFCGDRQGGSSWWDM